MKTKKRHIDICFSPEQFHLYKRTNNLVVVIDVFRATTAIITALYHGAESVAPVATLSETKKMGQKGYLTAGERDAIKVDEFNFGNSPLEFATPTIKGKSLAMSTTNGTKAFAASNGFNTIAAALINYNATLDYIKNAHQDILFLCSGWKMKMNIEDPLLAAKFSVDLLQNEEFYSTSDSIAIAQSILQKAGNDWKTFILGSSPRLRGKYDLLKHDIDYALNQDCCPIVAKVKDGKIVNA